MPEPIVTPETALSLIRSLDGAPGYPFHVEGETRAAEALRRCALSVSHAQAVIEEFESDFPTIEQIRNTAHRLREKFDPDLKAQREAEANREAQRHQDIQAVDGLRQAVPPIPGVRWEVCLQIQTIRIDLGMCGSPIDYERAQYDAREFPEAVAAIRSNRAPDYRLIEQALAKRVPGWNAGTRNGMRQVTAQPTEKKEPVTQADIDAELERRKQSA